MSPVIPTSEGAVSFYDDLHCKKFAYRREPGVLPVGRGIKILIGVRVKRILVFYCHSEHDHAFIWYVCSLLSVENLHLSELEVLTEQTQLMMRIRNKTNFEDHIKIDNLFELHAMIQAVSCLGSNFGELGKSKTTSLPTGPFMHHSFYGLTHLFWPRLSTRKSRPWPWPSERVKWNRGNTTKQRQSMRSVTVSPKFADSVQ